VRIVLIVDVNCKNVRLSAMEITKDDMLELKKLVEADEHLSEGDLDTALDLYSEIFEENPLNVEVRFKMASIVMNKGVHKLKDGKYGEAEALLKESLILCYDDKFVPYVLYNLALLYYIVSEDLEAMRLCKDFLHAFPEHKMTNDVVELMLKIKKEEEE